MMNTTTTFTLWNLGADHMVYELGEDVTPPGLALELHFLRTETGRPVAVWLLETGRVLRWVRPAAA